MESVCDVRSTKKIESNNGTCKSSLSAQSFHVFQFEGLELESTNPCSTSKSRTIHTAGKMRSCSSCLILVFSVETARNADVGVRLNMLKT